MKPFDLEAAQRGEKIVTRDGREFKLAGVNEAAEPNSQLLGWIHRQPACHYVSGRCSATEGDSIHDLFMTPREVARWVNLYVAPDGSIGAGRPRFDSEVQAYVTCAPEPGYVYCGTARVTLDV